LFKEEFGLTPENYLIVRKIAEAKKYLYMGASVKEACFLSGFHNYSNFIRTFKNFEGYSPGNLEKLTDPL
ncbi:MAG: helix-turn-helix domain-containing protein, partial [Eubacteriales bacterium]